MARGKSARRPPNRRATRRTRDRKFNLALGLRPVPCRIPADPPRIRLAYEQSAILMIDIIFETQIPRNEFASWGTPYNSAVYTIGSTTAKAQSMHVTYSDVIKLIQHRMEFDSTSTMEVCIRKISCWGILSSAIAGDPVPVLQVDLGGITAGTIVTDRGTLNNRTRCAVSMPFMQWFVDSATSFMRYTIDTQGVTPYHATAGRKNAGICHISVTWRKQPSTNNTAWLATPPPIASTYTGAILEAAVEGALELTPLGELCPLPVASNVGPFWVQLWIQDSVVCGVPHYIASKIRELYESAPQLFKYDGEDPEYPTSGILQFQVFKTKGLVEPSVKRYFRKTIFSQHRRRHAIWFSIA